MSGAFKALGHSISTPPSIVVQPTLRMTPCRQDFVISSSASFLNLPVCTRSRSSAHQPRQWRRRNGTDEAFRATLNNPSNGAEAEEHKAAQSKVTETNAIEIGDNPALQSVSNSRAKVSDKLKAAVKQVDKQVHEVIAVPVPQNVALAPQKHEHPGVDTCTFRFSAA